MRIYTAGPWKDREYVKAQADKLREAGHIVDCQWLTIHDDVAEDDPRREDYLKEQALQDLKDLAHSDMLMYFNTGRKSEGKATELGFAICCATIGWSIPNFPFPLQQVFIVGSKENNIFLHLGMPQYDTTEQAIEALVGTTEEDITAMEESILSMAPPAVE